MTYAVGRSTPGAAGPSAAFHRTVSAGGAHGDSFPPEGAGVPKKSDAEAALW